MKYQCPAHAHKMMSVSSRINRNRAFFQGCIFAAVLVMLVLISAPAKSFFQNWNFFGDTAPPADGGTKLSPDEGNAHSDMREMIKAHLIPPSTEKYNFSLSKHYKEHQLLDDNFNPSAGQVQALQSILNKLTPGFYVDCGANDGMFVSNTIWLEKKLGWQGLLVEADPNAFKILKSTNRRAWLSNICFSDTPDAKQITFFTNPKYSEASGIIRSKAYGATTPVSVDCFPLHQVLLALNRTTVDFLSLDVEGSELEILNTIPFDRIIFKVLTIEHLFIRDGKKTLRDFMTSKGYIFYRTVDAGDSIFIHPSVKLSEEEKRFLGSDTENAKQVYIRMKY